MQENLRGRAAGRGLPDRVTGRTWRAGCCAHVGLRGRPARPGRDADRGPAAPAGDRQGLRGRADAAHPRRAHRAAERGRGRAVLPAASASRSPTGTSVIYITHRLAEVRELADRVTVLRDGRVRGTARVAEITDQELLALILGRQLDSTFPPKHPGGGRRRPSLRLDRPGRPRLHRGVRRPCRAGEIVGLAGVVGNGQSSLLRALAGLEPFTGTVRARRPRAVRAGPAAAGRVHARRPAGRGAA